MAYFIGAYWRRKESGGVTTALFYLKSPQTRRLRANGRISS